MADKKEQKDSKPKTQAARRVTVLPTKEELVASTPNQRNWRGILIALLVIVVVLGLIVFSIFLLSPPDEGPRIKGHKFTLEDILDTSRFQVPEFNGSWISDVEIVYRDVYGGAATLNAETLSSRSLTDDILFKQYNAIDFKVSGDKNFILIVFDPTERHMSRFDAHYAIYEHESKSSYKLTPFEYDSYYYPSIQFVLWSPKGNALAFVYKNDVFYRPKANKSNVIQLTKTGQPGVVFNGVPDWLYGEEILKTPGAMWFSQDGEYLLYATFNDSLVGELKYPWYGGADLKYRYPQIRSLRYPKAGTMNPEVTLWAVSLKNPKDPLQPVALKPPKDILSQEPLTEHYFTAVTWVSSDMVSVVWMNRRQNLSVISLCKEPDWVCEYTHKEVVENKGWVDIYQPPIFSVDGSSYIIRLPVQDAENGYYKHVCFLDANDKHRAPVPLTHGQFEVIEILAWDEENNTIYFMATPENKPGQRHLYKVGDMNVSSRNIHCLTCTLNVADYLSTNSSELEPSCLYNQVHFSPAASPGTSPNYYILECLGPSTPSVMLVDLANNNTVISVLNSFSHLKERYKMMALPQVRTFQVAIQDNYQAQVRLHLPPGLREYEEMTFPLVLHVCASPGSQMVSDKWTVDWGTYLAGQRNFIVAHVDGRGSGFQGDRMLYEIQNRLGTAEIEDQIAVIKYLRDNLKFVNRQKIAVWGWSYGGFAAAMILAKDEDTFQCGISVAPITNWAHYDSVFAERYMGLPNVTENYRGYEESDITKLVKNLQNKTFLLIDGTADRTVHFQQSMMLVKALTEEGVLFRHQTYPDEGHTLAGVQKHLYTSMEGFLDECFGPLDFEEWEVSTSFFSFKQ